MRRSSYFSINPERYIDGDEYQAGNELISGFMGFTPNDPLTKEIRYQVTIKLLMEACKAACARYPLNLEDLRTAAYNFDTKAMWMALVEFIKWYQANPEKVADWSVEEQCFISPTMRALTLDPPRDPCPFCAKKHLDYACDHQIEFIKSGLESGELINKVRDNGS